MSRSLHVARWTPVLLAFGALGLAGCGGEKPAEAQGRGGGPGPGGPGAAPAAVPVAVEIVRSGTASSYYTATATLEPESHAQVTSRATGVVREIVREEGDRVKAGDLLLRLEDDQARWRVKQAEANLEMARADHTRGQAMREGDLLSAEEFEVMENTLSVREAELQLAQLELAHTRVVSPFTGQVVRRHVDLGANVNPGTALFDVMDVDPLLARVHVPARRMGYVKVGQPMEMRLDTLDATLTGRVSLVSPIVDPTTGTVKITAEIDGYPAGTRPGDFAEVRIVTARHEDAVLVPTRAIFEDQGTQIAYAVVDGKAMRKPVETGFVDGDDTEIVSGLTPGDIVVVKGQRNLRDDAAVKVLEGPPDVLAALGVTVEEPAAPAEAAGEDGPKDAS
ncbi:MAG: efflux RND transporter periplasmic adaptor subunit [Gemmatimonadetes bacterium]|nr:efflux RND transporter periplasmic adaptor subunit [Gemmatimonadota bacterium]